MWKYTNIRFIYENRVDSIFNEEGKVDSLTTYIKSKYALMQALRYHVDSSYLGPYTDIDPRTITYNKPIKI